jgi:hypothetical protein
VDALLTRLATDAQQAAEVNQDLRVQLQHAKDALKQWHADYQSKLVASRETLDTDAIKLMTKAQRQAEDVAAQAQGCRTPASWEGQSRADGVLAAAQHKADVEAERAVHAYRQDPGGRYAAELEEMERRLAWVTAFTDAVQVELTTTAQAFVDEIGRLADIDPGWSSAPEAGSGGAQG